MSLSPMVTCVCALTCCQQGVSCLSNAEAVTEARKPESASQICSFLGLVNFCARFIPDLAITLEPLRKLKRGDFSFYWDKEQDRAFTESKKTLDNTEALGYFSRDAKTHLITDASPVCLDAASRAQKDGCNKHGD